MSFYVFTQVVLQMGLKFNNSVINPGLICVIVGTPCQEKHFHFKIFFLNRRNVMSNAEQQKRHLFVLFSSHFVFHGDSPLLYHSQ